MAMLLRACLVGLLVAVVVCQHQRPTSGQSIFQQQRNSIRRIQNNRRVQIARRPVTPRPTTTTTSIPSTKQVSGGQLLVPPEPKLCASRPKHWRANGHWYFYSGHERAYQVPDEKTGELVGKRVNWLEARNICRRYCMDSISIETEDEWQMVKKNITDNEIIYLWTSGRLCDFTGCESREDLKPLEINGWFWSGTNVKMAPTNQAPPGWTEQPWSPTGHLKKPQPDNAEYTINQTSEPCLGVLYGVYDDGIKWHDIACYHPKTVICEDNAVLLKYARDVNLRDNLGLVIN